MMATSHTDNNIYDEVKESFELQSNTGYGEVKPRSVTTKEGKTSSDKKVVVIVFMAVTVLLMFTAGACIGFTLKIVELESEIARLESEIARLDFDTVALYQNFSQLLKTQEEMSSEAVDATGREIEMIYRNISQSYSSLKIDIGILQEQTIQNISGTAIEFQSLVGAFYQNLSQNHINALENLENTSIDELNQRINNLEIFHGLHTVSSCAALFPSSPSGYYWVCMCTVT
jgi:uncharacterized small protein (DUF1192 family)